MTSGNRVEQLETQVAELQATVKGLTEELVEANDRIRQLEAALGSEEGPEGYDWDAELLDDEVAPFGDDGEGAVDSDGGVESGDVTETGDAADPGVEAGDEGAEAGDADRDKGDEDDGGDEEDLDDIIVA